MNDTAEYTAQDKLLDWKRVCQIFDNPKVHRRHPGWKDVLDTCAVFDFRGHDYEKLRAEIGISDNAEELMAPLPFPKIAIVHDWQCYAVDLFYVSEESNILAGNILAIMCPFPEHRHVYEVVISGYVEIDISEKATDDTGTFFNGKPSMSDVCYTTMINGNPTAIHGNGEAHSALRKNDIDPNGHKATDVLPGLLVNITSFLAYINAPERYIVQQTPQKMGKPKKGQIPRIYQRPQYIILDKQGIKTRYTDSQPSDRRSPMPHLRRGHYRTLTAERYKAKQGQRVWVRATHIKGNEVEWREGDRFYKVI